MAALAQESRPRRLRPTGPHRRPGAPRPATDPPQAVPGDRPLVTALPRVSAVPALRKSTAPPPAVSEGLRAPSAPPLDHHLRLMVRLQAVPVSEHHHLLVTALLGSVDHLRPVTALLVLGSVDHLRLAMVLLPAVLGSVHLLPTMVLLVLVSEDHLRPVTAPLEVSEAIPDRLVR